MTSNEYKLAWYHANKHRINRTLRREQNRRYRAAHPEKVAAWNKAAVARKTITGERSIANKKLRLLVFEAYGGAYCACCGVKDYEFLTMDHINKGGAEHRRKLGKGASIYRWLKKNNFPPGFRVLCWNCNCARGHYGFCPHEVLGTGVDLEDGGTLTDPLIKECVL